MANNQQNSNQGTQTQNHRSLAENIGISENLEDFGGGRGQAAGVQESASSQDQFSEDVTQIVDENDFEGKVTPREPFDYYDREEDKKDE
ncbi:MAG TPA: hypothetical protein VIL74_16695 [Pyrinomonadaceae bacterium]|jgi:hypothetical protein